MPIGVVPVPDSLRPFPLMRGGNKQVPWRMVLFAGGKSERLLGPATDPSLPIYQVVNDTRLKEMIVSDWRPKQMW